MHNVLYIHGMGGGGDSRIPSILADVLSADDINVVVRTYDFDPEIVENILQQHTWICKEKLENDITGYMIDFEQSLDYTILKQ